MNTDVISEQVHAHTYDDDDNLVVAECEVECLYNINSHGVIKYDVRFWLILVDGIDTMEQQLRNDVVNRLWHRAVESFGDSTMESIAAGMWQMASREYYAEQEAIVNLQKSEAA